MDLVERAERLENGDKAIKMLKIVFHTSDFQMDLSSYYAELIFDDVALYKTLDSLSEAVFDVYKFILHGKALLLWGGLAGTVDIFSPAW